jgi:anaerobic magnesium-protoporphyrin IX monomethyl ester cyclase
MKTLLIFPPAAEVAHPPLGIASLTGFLKAHGEDTCQLDLNLRSYHDLLSARHLRRCGRRLRKRLRQLEMSARLSAPEAEEYRRVVKASLAESFLTDRLARSLAELRTPDAYASRSKYQEVASAIWRGMELVSASHHPVQWTPVDFRMSYEPTRSSEVLRAVSDRNQNIFLPFFESVLPDIAAIRPDVVGISINYHTQIIPGITLASLLRRFLKGMYVVVGGSLVGYFEDDWEVLRPFARVVDGFIPFEGEMPLLRLVQTLERGQPTSTVPGLVQFVGNSVEFTAAEPPPDVRTLAVPDFSDLPLDEYLSPQRVLPALMTRGCYWGRCAFCTHDHLYRGRYRPKPVLQVLAELECLSRRFETTHFYFVDESLPPAPMRELARTISRRGLPYQWFGDLRFEPSLGPEWFEQVRRGGCMHLILGLESAADRVLSAMDKGTDGAAMSRILRNCRDCGIRTFVMFIVGFPGETQVEVEETVRFLERHEDCISHAAFGRFVLEKKSRVYAEPARFGVERVPLDPVEDLAVHCGYSVGHGLSSSESATLVQQLRARGVIGRLVGLRAVARTHVAFLPPRDGLDEAPEQGTVFPDRERFENLRPVLKEGVAPVTLPFDLCAINEWLDSGDMDRLADHIDCRPTNYVFIPQSDKLIAVGRHGLLLLGQCDGRRDLRTVLSSLNEIDREIAMQFYVEASRAGCLAWRESFKQEARLT